MSKLTAAILLALCAAASTSTHLRAESVAAGLLVEHPEQRRLLGQRFDHYIRDFKTGEMVFEATDDDWAWLLAQGFKPRLDTVRTAQLMQRDLMMAKAIPGFACYPTVAETYTAMDTLIAAHPGLASKVDIGDSWEKFSPGGNAGSDLFVLKITNSAIVADKPKFFAMSAVHARELVTAPLTLGFAQWLLDNYGTDANATWLVDHNEFHLLLQANPDGRLFVEQGNFDQRKNRNPTNGGTNLSLGVDLNRNYPFGWNAFGNSSGSPSAQDYHGPSASSEPENQAVVSYINSIFPDRRPGAPSTGDLTTPAAIDTRGLFFDIHSNANSVIWPWGMTGSPGNPLTGNNAAFVALGRRLTWFNGYEPIQSNSLPADGASDDNAYSSLGVPAFTVELGGNGFQADCTTFNTEIFPDNMEMLKYASRVLNAPYLLPSGPDSRDIHIEPNLPFPGETIRVTAVADDTRFNNSNGTQATQSIASANAYFDVVPWQAAAIPNAMSAADGSFNTSSEAVSVDLSTAGLSAGQHLLFVQSSDTAAAGPPNAVFFNLVDAASVGTLSGVVRDADSSAPLIATLTIGADALQSAADGSYGYRSLPTTINLTARRPGYLDESVTSIPLTAGQTSVRNIGMLTTCNAFVDDVQGPNPGWTAQAPWGTQTGVGVGGASTTFWSDSPAGNYANNLTAGVSLTSPVRDFTGLDGVRLEFDHRCITEATFDFGNVEYSTNGGSTWSSFVFRCDGETNTAWRHESIQLSQLDNQANARVRFRFTTDSSQVREGWWIDNIRLESAGPACRAAHVPPMEIFANGFE
jgi:carboxypeptidase T